MVSQTSPQQQNSTSKGTIWQACYGPPDTPSPLATGHEYNCKQLDTLCKTTKVSRKGLPVEKSKNLFKPPKAKSEPECYLCLCYSLLDVCCEACAYELKSKNVSSVNVRMSMLLIMIGNSLQRGSISFIEPTFCLCVLYMYASVRPNNLYFSVLCAQLCPSPMLLLAGVAVCILCNFRRRVSLQ